MTQNARLSELDNVLVTHLDIEDTESIEPEPTLVASSVRGPPLS